MCLWFFPKQNSEEQAAGRQCCCTAAAPPRGRGTAAKERRGRRNRSGKAVSPPPTGRATATTTHNRLPVHRGRSVRAGNRRANVRRPGAFFPSIIYLLIFSIDFLRRNRVGPCSRVQRATPGPDRRRSTFGTIARPSVGENHGKIGGDDVTDPTHAAMYSARNRNAVIAGECVHGTSVGRDRAAGRPTGARSGTGTRLIF